MSAPASSSFSSSGAAAPAFSSPSSSLAARFRKLAHEAMDMMGIEGDVANEMYVLTCEPGHGVWDGNMVNGDKPLLWKRAPSEVGSKKCSVCKTSKPESDYSGAQLKRQGKRKCADCVLSSQWNAPLPGPSGPNEPHAIMLMNVQDETDGGPFLPRWSKDELPAEFTWLAPDAPASTKPPDAATLAVRRAIVEPFFHNLPFDQGGVLMIDSARPYWTPTNTMKSKRMWIKTSIRFK